MFAFQTLVLPVADVWYIIYSKPYGESLTPFVKKDLFKQ